MRTSIVIGTSGLVAGLAGVGIARWRATDKKQAAHAMDQLRIYNVLTPMLTFYGGLLYATNPAVAPVWWIARTAGTATLITGATVLWTAAITTDSELCGDPEDKKDQ